MTSSTIVFGGKLILVISLCLQGYLLILDDDAKMVFDSRVIAVANHVPQLNVLNDFTQYFDYIRFALAGMYFLSFFLLEWSCACISLLPAFGVIVNTILQTLPTLKNNSQDIHATIIVLKNLSILGGLLFLMGSKNCTQTAPAAATPIADEQKKKNE